MVLNLIQLLQFYPEYVGTVIANNILIISQRSKALFCSCCSQSKQNPPHLYSTLVTPHLLLHSTQLKQHIFQEFFPEFQS